MSDEDPPFVRVGEAGQIRQNTCVDFVIDDEHSVLVCNQNGRLYAIRDICTHDQGPLGKGRLYGFDVECPRHGAKFDIRTGKPTALPAFQPTTTYPVREVDGYIEVQFTKPTASSFDDPMGYRGA